jgi:hypothetical protein
MRGTKALIITVALAAIGGCGTPPSTAATPTPTATTSAVRPAGSGTWTTTGVTVAHTPPVPPVPVLTGIRYAAHREGFDRIVLDVPGALPGYSAKYVTEVRRDGSGAPVPVPGKAFLLLVLHPAQAHRTDGTPTVTGVHRTGLSGITAYAITGDYEGYVSIALGLSGVREFHIAELPDRIYVDVAT